MQNNDVILCPHCGVKVRNNWRTTKPLEMSEVAINVEKKITGKKGIELWYCECENCQKLVVLLVHGILFYRQNYGSWEINRILSSSFLYPEVKNLKSTEYIPPDFANEFNEAVNVLAISPKSSAALTRRILQNILREYYNIEERTLDAEINKFIQLPNIPSHLTDAVDAVRTIGNIAAHPTKDKNTGTIVDVESGEAEWLIEVIEALFDFTFIQPKKLEERRSRLNEKLKELGKPELKSGK